MKKGSAQEDMQVTSASQQHLSQHQSRLCSLPLELLYMIFESLYENKPPTQLFHRRCKDYKNHKPQQEKCGWKTRNPTNNWKLLATCRQLYAQLAPLLSMLLDVSVLYDTTGSNSKDNINPICLQYMLRDQTPIFVGYPGEPYVTIQHLIKLRRVRIQILIWETKVCWLDFETALRQLQIVFTKKNFNLEVIFDIPPCSCYLRKQTTMMSHLKKRHLGAFRFLAAMQRNLCADLYAELLVDLLDPVPKDEKARSKPSKCPRCDSECSRRYYDKEADEVGDAACSGCDRCVKWQVSGHSFVMLWCKLWDDQREVRTRERNKMRRRMQQKRL